MTIPISFNLPDAAITAVPDGDGYLVTFDFNPEVLVRHVRPFTEKYSAAQFETLKQQAGK